MQEPALSTPQESFWENMLVRIQYEREALRNPYLILPECTQTHRRAPTESRIFEQSTNDIWSVTTLSSSVGDPL